MKPVGTWTGVMVAALLCVPTAVLAAGAPSGALTYAGVVTDETGVALGGQQVKVSVYTSASDDGSAAVCASKPVTTDELGHFVAVLDKCDAAVHNFTELYTEVVVGKSNATTLPRERITPAAYALEADMASGASGALAATLASLTQQIAEFGKKIVGVLTAQDLSPINAALQGLKTEVAGLKAVPKVTAQVVELTWGSGTMVETNAGTLVLDISWWVAPQALYAQLKPEFKLDGQVVGIMNSVDLQVPYGTKMFVQGKVAVAVSAGKHFLEAGGGAWACAAPNGKCPAILYVLP
jgi:hypothetical protein